MDAGGPSQAHVPAGFHQGLRTSRLPWEHGREEEMRGLSANSFVSAPLPSSQKQGHHYGNTRACTRQMAGATPSLLKGGELGSEHGQEAVAMLLVLLMGQEEGHPRAGACQGGAGPQSQCYSSTSQGRVPAPRSSQAKYLIGLLGQQAGAVMGLNIKGGAK